MKRNLSLFMPNPQRILLPLLLAVLTLLSGSAWAGDKLMVLPFSGLKKQQTTERASQALEASGNTVVKDDAPSASDKSALQSTAKETGVRAFVAGDIAMVGKQWTLKVKLLGSDGESLGDFSLKSSWYPGLLKEIDRNLPTTVADLLGAAKAEPVAEDADETPEEEAADEEPADEEEDEPEDDAGPGPSPLNVSLQFGAAIRNWTPKDALFDQVLSQENVGLLAPRLRFGIYPVAFFSSGALANLGVIGSFEQSISGETQVPAIGATPATTASMSEQEYWFGLNFRVPAGEHQIHFSAGPGKHSVTTEIPPGYFIPDVGYSYFRFGFGGELRLGSLGLGLGAAYRPVSSLDDDEGQVASPDWFANAEADGVELEVELNYGLTESLFLVLTGDYRRYGFNFHRTPADQAMTQPTTGQPLPIAGGASDAYLGFWAGAAYRMPH